MASQSVEGIPAPPELKTYYGNCHCGTFKFHILIPELVSVTECTCSICSKKDYKWVFPGENCFIVDKGEGTLKDYEFNHHAMSHRFCPKCGTSVVGMRNMSMFPPSMEFAVNVCTFSLSEIGKLIGNRFEHFRMWT
jgi:hypothetical protein